jgi:two-component system, NarL family, sensor histidine kinase UhpB
VDALAHQAALQGLQDIQASAERIATIVDQAYESARDIVTRLRPEVIDTLGLGGAIQEMVRRLGEASTQCRFQAVVAPALPAMHERVAIAAYRLTQEALSNVVKHAGASMCLVSVSAGATAPVVEISVRDDGVGFDAAAMTLGLGIAGMRERTAALGGTLRIRSRPGGGTDVTVRLPVGPG